MKKTIVIIIIVLLALLCLLFGVRAMMNRNDQTTDEQGEVQTETSAENSSEPVPTETAEILPSSASEAPSTDENEKTEKAPEDESTEGVIVLTEDEDMDSGSESDSNNGSESYQIVESPDYDEDELPPIVIN